MTKLTNKTALYRWLFIVLMLIISIAVSVRWVLRAPTVIPEVVLTIGESYAQMIKDSTPGVIDPNTLSWGYYYVNKVAQLRFNDPQYGFITPTAAPKFFVVSYDNGIIGIIHISPQLDTLNLNDAINVILNLQDKWRKAGWILSEPNTAPAYENTPEIREKLKNGQSPTTYWRAANKYEIMIFLNRAPDTAFSHEAQYRISMAISNLSSQR